MTREEVKKEILKRWDSIWELFENNYNIGIDRLKLKQRKDYKQELVFDIKRSRKKSKYLKVVFGKESICSKNKGLTDEDILVEVVNRAGIEAVYSMNIPVKEKYNLIEKNTNDINTNAYRILSSDWAIFVKTGIGDKYAQIDRIIKERKLDASVSWEE